MKPELATLARYRLSRAKEALEDAMVLLEKGSLSSAINRLYYAAFYAARGLLATKGLDSSRHSGVISLFNQHFVKSGVIDQMVAKALPRSFEKRLNTDYEDFASVDRGEVEQVKDDVQRFVNECQRRLDALIGTRKAKPAQSPGRGKR